ncbi:phosphodiester glycosidase family protein, partial [Bacillus sp. SIMBA_074]
MQDPKLTTLSAQRSFIGYTADNQLVMGTVPNVTLNQLAVICQSMGLQAAMNLDGGASSGLYAKGKLLTRPGRNLS